MRLPPFALVVAPLFSLACMTSDGVDGDGCALTDPRGAVTIEAFTGSGFEGLRVTLGFQRQPSPRDAINCTRRTAGACTITTCLQRPIDFVNGEPTCPGATAGEVRLRRESGVTYATSSGAQFTLAPPPTAGESFDVRSTGGIVPAFAGRVALPPRLSITAPAEIVRGTTLTVASGEGLTVRWAPIASRVVVTTRGGNGDTTAECTYDGTAGEGRVPTEALGDDAASIAVTSYNETRLVAGAYPITLQARWQGAVSGLVVRAP
ncbi:MAG: hypothetical protein U0326_20435 [Polyangiales bacterium]